MVTRQQVLALLPAFNNEYKIANWGQSTNTIGKEIIKAHEKYQDQYNSIYYLFDTGDIYSTGQQLWDFCKYQLKYTKEDIDEQSVKSPSAILQPGEKVDCKHYSLFISGVLDAIKTNEGDNWTWCYRLASERRDKEIGHIYVVVFVNGKEVWIDPVMGSYNEKCSWTKIEDIEPMPVYSISGIENAVVEKPNYVDVDKKTAERNFLYMVRNDLFSYKTLLTSDTAVLYGPVKNWYIDNGFDFEVLMRILKS